MTESGKWLIFAGVVLTGWLIYLLAPILTPFMVAATLAYIGDPLVDRLEARKLPRTAAVMVVFVGFSLLGLLLIVTLVPLLERQVVVFVNKLPGYIAWFQQTALPWVGAKLGMDGLALDLGSLETSIREHWQSAGGVAASVLASVTRSGLALVGWLVNLVLIPVVTFYLLRDWDILVGRIRELLPRRSEAVICRLAGESDEVLGAFFRGQLLVMLALAVIYSTGLWIVGLDLALLIGLIAGVVSFVPYLGFIVGIVIAGIAAMMQFHDMSYLLYVAIVFGVGQAAEGMLLTPMLVGDRIGLHPVAVIFAVLAGGQLFGFLGVLLALPVAAVVVVILRYVHKRYKDSELYAS